MKSFLTTLALLFACATALADTAPSKQLIEQYLKVAEPEKSIAAQVEGYADQLAAGARAEDRAQLLQYLNATIGWATIKDQYAALVGKIYTAEELKAAMAFLRSPVGPSIVKKNQIFAKELATLIAANVQRASIPVSSPPSPEGAAKSAEGGAKAAAGVELVAVDVEERNLDGKTYFTGAIENRGKRPARAVQVEVNLFRNGEFVDQYTTYVSGNVVPGASRYFKVSCGCKDSPPAKHDSFKVQLVEGY